MLAGKFDRRIELRRQIAGTDGAGQPNGEWITVDTVWAEFKPASGREITAAVVAQAEAPATFRIRWRADVEATWLIRYRDLDYNIKSMVEVGRREGLDIYAIAAAL